MLDVASQQSRARMNTKRTVIGVRWNTLLVCATASLAALPCTARAQSPNAVQEIRDARLRGTLADAQRLAEHHLAADGLRPAEEVALHLELARIHDRYGLHHNTRPVRAAMEHVDAAAGVAGPDTTDLLAAVELARAELWYRVGMRDRQFLEAERHARRAVDLCRLLEDQHGEAEAVHRLGLIELQRGNLDTARVHFEESRSLDIAAGERPFFQGEYERHIAFVELFEGNVEAAIPHLQRSLALRRQSGAIDASMFAANTLASALVTAGRAEEARRPLLYAMTVAESLGSPVGRARNGLVAGRLYSALGDEDAARIAFDQVVSLAESLGSRSLAEAASAALDSLQTAP